MMAHSLKDVGAMLTIGENGLDVMRKAMQEAGISMALAGSAFSKVNVLGPSSRHQTVVSRREYEALAAQFAQQSQRLKMLLVLLSDDELRRLGLISDSTDDASHDRDFMKLIGALDARVEQFNAAHTRLSGKRKRIPETGMLGNLSGEEMGLVLKSRAAGDSIQDTLQKLEALRKEISK